jgi:tRNA-2-methylthio-N6-dimethylallyladenosine synthase
MKTKEDRLHKLNEVINSYSNAANQKYLNKIVPVLIEGISEKDSNKVFGYTDPMKLVNVTNASDKIGQIIDVKITEAKSFSLDGEAI